MIYLDTSAAAKAIIEEPESEAIRELFADGTQFVSSKLLAAELHSVADRRVIDPADADDLLDRVALVTLDSEIMDRAITMHSGLRTLDALHLATAVYLGTAITGILTFDKELAGAAVRYGIRPAALPT